MGVAGDGIVEPSILASHSFGETPILNNRIANTRSVTVTIQDTSVRGNYNLTTANNVLQLDGANATVSPRASKFLRRSGPFTAASQLTRQNRDASSAKQFSGNRRKARRKLGELGMPMYLRALSTVPAARQLRRRKPSRHGACRRHRCSGSRRRDLCDVPFAVSPASQD